MVPLFLYSLYFSLYITDNTSLKQSVRLRDDYFFTRFRSLRTLNRQDVNRGVRLFTVNRTNFLELSLATDQVRRLVKNCLHG